MNNLRTLITGATSLVTVSLAHGAAFIDNFTGLTPGTPGTSLNTYNGWTQSEPNPGGDPLAWGQTVGGSNGFGLGPVYGAPSGNPFYASHALGYSLANSSLLTTFVIVDSDSAFPQRNDYSIGIYNSLGIRLFSLDLLATSQPGPGTANDQWNVRWGTGATNSSAFGGVLEDGLYNLVVGFTPNGANVDFNLTITGANTIGTSGTLTGLAAASIAEYRVGTSIGTGSNWGDGLIGIDNVAVPEPSAALLLGLGALGLARRRRN